MLRRLLLQGCVAATARHMTSGLVQAADRTDLTLEAASKLIRKRASLPWS